MIIPKLQEEMGTPLGKVNSILEEVDRKMEEFQEWVNYLKPTDMTTKIPMEIVNTLNEIILDRSPSTTMESVGHGVEQLEGVVCFNRQTKEHVRSTMVELQEKVSNQLFNTPKARDYVPYVEAGSIDQESLRSNPTSMEREAVRKGIERIEKQLPQLISVFISRD